MNAKQLSAPGKAGSHLVDNEQNVMLICNRTNSRQIAVGRNGDIAVSGGDARLRNDGCNVSPRKTLCESIDELCEC